MGWAGNGVKSKILFERGKDILWNRCMFWIALNPFTRRVKPRVGDATFSNLS